jgi:hypothetical protein
VGADVYKMRAGPQKAAQESGGLRLILSAGEGQPTPVLDAGEAIETDPAQVHPPGSQHPSPEPTKRGPPMGGQQHTRRSSDKEPV